MSLQLLPILEPFVYRSTAASSHQPSLVFQFLLLNWFGVAFSSKMLLSIAALALYFLLSSLQFFQHPLHYSINWLGAYIFTSQRPCSSLALNWLTDFFEFESLNQCFAMCLGTLKHKFNGLLSLWLMNTLQEFLFGKALIDIIIYWWLVSPSYKMNYVSFVLL